jgi:hypothetical protein
MSTEPFELEIWEEEAERFLASLGMTATGWGDFDFEISVGEGRRKINIEERTLKTEGRGTRRRQRLCHPSGVHLKENNIAARSQGFHPGLDCAAPLAGLGQG